MLDVAMGANDIFWALPLMVITPRRKPSSSSTAAYGTVAESATPTKLNEMRWYEGTARAGQSHGRLPMA